MIERLVGRRTSAVTLALCLATGAWGGEPAPGPEAPGTKAAPPGGSISPVESLAMLNQVISRLELSVKSKDLSSIHNEDLILGVALNSLIAAASVEVPDQPETFKDELITLGLRVAALHTDADAGKQTESEAALRKVLAMYYQVRSRVREATRQAAQALSDRHMCPMHPEVTGDQRSLCSKCGMTLDQPIRVLPPGPGLPGVSPHSLRAEIRTAAPLAIGQPARAILRLSRKNGNPVLLADLIETHTRKIHLLIIDGSLTDYHHEHPEPTATSGEYAFTFTPRKPGPYRAWADLRPFPIGLQEYVMIDIPAPTAGEPLTDRTIRHLAKVDGLSYELVLEDREIKVGEPAAARLRITGPDGQGFTRLEPVMATFAHLVGFNEDFQTVLHMHPKGPPVLNPLARGGPELRFQIYALKPGFVRLFAQVQIDGRQQFAPFGIRIEP
jgi:heavy metal-binding protein